MIIINNVPCEVVELFPSEIEFILLHKIIDNEHYREYHLKQKDSTKYKILDNSAFELGAGLDDELLLEWAVKLNVNEIIIPDVYGDKEKTLVLMREFFSKHPECPFKLQVVPQGKNQEELFDCYHQMINHVKVDVIGINKLWNRKALKNTLSRTIKPIHLLGVNSISEWFYDYGDLNIRSADSRVLSKIVLGTEDIWECEVGDEQLFLLSHLIEDFEKWK